MEPLRAGARRGAPSKAGVHAFTEALRAQLDEALALLTESPTSRTVTR